MDKKNNCVHLDYDGSTCKIAKIPCEKVVICTPMCVYIDKEDEPVEQEESENTDE